MDKEEYPSDSDQSDEDFCPANIDSEVSESGSDDSNEESEENHKNGEKVKTPKQKKKRVGRRKKKVKEEDSEQEELVSDDEVEKKRSNALWQNFLNDVSSTSMESKSSKEPQKTDDTNNKTTPHSAVSETTKKKPSEKIKTTEVFEFAGEKVTVTKETEVSNSVKANTASISESTAAPKHSSNIPRGPVKRTQGMLSSVLNSINKKNKLSVLEKTKMDWDSFKQNEGLSEELKTFNKGKEGFLEKRDFLERTDVRQFEIEKNLRQSKRSKR